MAKTATKTPPRRKPATKASGAGRRTPSANGARAANSRTNGKGPGQAARKTAAAVSEAAPGGGSPVGKLARKAALKGLKVIGRRALRSGVAVLRSAAEQSSEAGRRAMEAGMSRRVPIQVSIDIAVPIDVVWDEWMAFESISEGVDRVQDIERDGDVLTGQIGAARSREWVAEVVDERPLQSFAWRSTEGSDCAGLVTFHELAARLTRVEVDLDVLPTGPLQTVAFASHLAHRRAEADLRRFKARVEFINPDVYEPAQGSGEEDEPEDAGASDHTGPGDDDNQ